MEKATSLWEDTVRLATYGGHQDGAMLFVFPLFPRPFLLSITVPTAPYAGTVWSASTTTAESSALALPETTFSFSIYFSCVPVSGHS